MEQFTSVSKLVQVLLPEFLFNLSATTSTFQPSHAIMSPHPYGGKTFMSVHRHTRFMMMSENVLLLLMNANRSGEIDGACNICSAG